MVSDLIYSGKNAILCVCFRTDFEHMSEKHLRCGVIGTGYLGRFHAQKYQLLENAHLVAVCDTDAAAVGRVAEELGVSAFTDIQALFGKVDAVSIAATTKAHFSIARACLEAGIHVLIEKPMTTTVQEADTLIALARARGLKLQVGHLERFNAARLAVEPYLKNPLFIESQRIAPFTPRGTDVNVILDVMIHDIDMILSMVKSPVAHIDAQGAPVLTSDPDIASARLTFANGAVANVTASRISFKTVRKTRIFQPDSYLSIDFQNKQFAVFHKGEGEMFPGIPEIIRHESVFEKGDSLLEEIRAFTRCILDDTTPLVTGEDGRDALATAETISQMIRKNLEAHEARAREAHRTDSR